MQTGKIMDVTRETTRSLLLYQNASLDNPVMRGKWVYQIHLRDPVCGQKY